jgi:hypothetical protein
MAIQFRRGNEADYDASKLLAGEPAYTIDTKQIRVGGGDGSARRIMTAEDFANGAGGKNPNKTDRAVAADSATPGSTLESILAGLPIESGSWTPTIEFSTGAASGYTAQQGSYVKIGKLVIVSFKVVVSTFSGDSTGYAYITHFPYIPEVTDINGAVVIPYYSGLVSKIGPTLFAWPSGGWAMVLYENGNNGNTLLTKGNFASGSRLAGTFAYIVAS